MRVQAKVSTLLLIGFLLTGLVVVGWYAYQWNARLIRVGERRIDPLANIDPTRRYDVLVWEHDLFIPGVATEERQAALEAAAATLADVYPNISIAFEFIEADKAVETLTEALAAGVGPDIASLTHGGMLVDAAHQVPIESYRTVEAADDLLPSVARAVQQNEHVWAWPRWASLSFWLGHTEHLDGLNAPLLPLSTLTEQGHVWKSALGNRPPIAYNAYDVDLFNGIVVANTGRSLLSDTGELQWTQKDLEDAAHLLHHLLDHGLMAKEVPTVSRNRLRSFWEGGAALIAPVDHTLLHHAISRVGELTHDPDHPNARSGPSQLTITSAPFMSEDLNGSHGYVAGYGVFLREEHAGDDHTRVAMLVAQHLSRTAGYWEAATLLTVPAYASSLAHWERDSGLMQVHVHSMTELARRLVAPPIDYGWARLEAECLTEVILPRLPGLIQGDMAPKTFAEAVWRDLHSLISSRQGHESSLEIH